MAQLKTELPTTTAALIEVAKGATNIGALEITRINSFVDGALRQVYMGRTTYGSLTLITAAVQQGSEVDAVKAIRAQAEIFDAVAEVIDNKGNPNSMYVNQPYRVLRLTARAGHSTDGIWYVMF